MNKPRLMGAVCVTDASVITLPFHAALTYVRKRSVVGLLAGSFLFTGIAYADPTVELQILNAAGASGEVIVVAGEGVEVDFNVALDSASVLRKKDTLELVNLADDSLVTAKQRGNNTSGSVILAVPRKSMAGQFYVRYVRDDDGTEIARVSHPDDAGYIPLGVVAESSVSDLTVRVASLEATDPVPGPQGEQGPAGADSMVAGPQGIQGASGANGATGPQGPIGQTGADGAAGATGPQGIPGIDGQDGVTGADGAQGLAGADGQDGLACWDLNGDGQPDESEDVNVDGTVDVVDCVGAQGVAGADGVDGAPGLASADGANGQDGATGPQGLAGAPGIPGNDGATGSPGDTGAQGPIGLTGADGAAGATGPVGDPSTDTLGALSCLDGESAISDGTGWSCGSPEVSVVDPVIADLLARIAVLEAPSYVIGEEGPAGGTVFYITDGGLHGLEAAPEDQDYAEWGCNEVTIPGADGTTVGTGAQNTADIVAGCPSIGIAAQTATAYTYNGFSDWFLPSKDELNLIYANLYLKQLGSFAGDPYTNYWSSSEDSANSAWFMSLYYGNLSIQPKHTTFRVRAVRAF